MARLLSEAITRGAFPVLTSDLSSGKSRPDPVQTVFYLPVAPDQAARVAGPASLSLVIR